jgi:perosamine synthetase
MTRDDPLPLVKVLMPGREILMPRLEAALYGGMIAEGQEVYDFEAKFAAKFGLGRALATNSGTAALHIAFVLAGAGPGREIITTSMTAEPTNTTILQTGATPVFADVVPDTGNLDPASVAACITARTCAICVVHYAGYPAEMRELRALADQHGLALIEDCAHALGARFGGDAIGTIGDSAIYSFQAIKHMTTVDGGMLRLRARRLRWFGLTKGVARTEIDIAEAGYKYNMSNVTATIGRAQLSVIDAAIARHIDNGRFFDTALAQIADAAPSAIAVSAEPSYWLYTLLSDHADDIIAALAAVGVMASKLHRPNHYHSIFAPYRRELPGLETFYRRLVHLPCGWWVSDEDRQLIVETIARG